MLQKKHFKILKDGNEFILGEVPKFTNRMCSVPIDYQFVFDNKEDALNECRFIFWEQENGHFINTEVATPDHQKEYEVLETPNWIDFTNGA